MKVFMIEAYGGKQGTDGAIAMFTVHAEDVEQAIEMIRQSESGDRFGRFEIVEEGGEVETEEPDIVEVRDLPTTKMC